MIPQEKLKSLENEIRTLYAAMTEENKAKALLYLAKIRAEQAAAQK